MKKSLPHVSAVLKVLDNPYEDCPNGNLERARERGAALHGIACQHLAAMQGLCELPQIIPPECQLGYAGFLAWITENDVQPVLTEEVSVNQKEGYCGTPDCLVRYGVNGPLILPDFKFTAALLRTNYVQVQAYWRLEDYAAAERAYLIHINHQTGTYHPEPVIQNPADWYAFKSALNVLNWRNA